MRLVQITDTHLYANPSQTLLKLNTQQSFEEVVALLKSDVKKPDIIVLTGDMSQDNSEAAYERVVKAFQSFSCPVYWIPGNHDDPELLETVFSKSTFKDDKAVVVDEWLLIFLNSHYPKHVAGLLSRSELSRLEHFLSQHHDKHAMLFLHHPPVSVGSAWLDKSRLTNPDDLFNITDKHSNIRAIISGHAHQAYETHRQGVPILSTPSTCIQFLSHSQQFALDTLSPGYRWIELQADGKFKTGVERVKNFENTVDFSATGY